MQATNIPFTFDNTLRIKSEADMMELAGDKLLQIPKVKENFLFSVGQSVKATSKGLSKEGRQGKVLGRFKNPAGYAQYVVAWNDTPKKLQPYKSANEWVVFYKDNGFETFAPIERQKDLTLAD